MNPITIITVVVVIALTIIIFILAWAAYYYSLKAYKAEVDQGKCDKEICAEYTAKKKKLQILLSVFSYILLAFVIALFIAGVVFKAQNKDLEINGKVALVIRTGSMSKNYDEEIYDDSLQFSIGDICIFERVEQETELIEGEVYGYKNNNTIITHRLINIYSTGYEFKGDANAISDYEYSGKLVKRENIIYHYTGKKIEGIGSFVLYLKSYLGIWSFIAIASIIINSELANHQFNKVNKKRLSYLKQIKDEA